MTSNEPKTNSHISDFNVKEAERFKKEMKNAKQMLDEETKTLLTKLKLLIYNTEDLQKLITRGFKYNLELLDNESFDYNLLKESLSLDINNSAFKIHRVVPNNVTKTKTQTSDYSKILLLHGTKGYNVRGILNEGFKPSPTGAYGPGLYLTNSFDMASVYGLGHGLENDMVKGLKYLFVGQVELSSKPKYDKFRTYYKQRQSFEEYLNSETEILLLNNKMCLNVYDGETFENCTKNKYDSNNSIIINGTFQSTINEANITLAHHSLVVPAYLVEIIENKTLDIIVGELVKTKHIFNGKRLNKKEIKALVVLQKFIHSNISDLNDCSYEVLKEKLEKSMGDYHQKWLDFMQKKKTLALMQAFSFKMSSLFDTEKDKNLKYKLELLPKEDKDYQRIF